MIFFNGPDNSINTIKDIVHSSNFKKVNIHIELYGGD